MNENIQIRMETGMDTFTLKCFQLFLEIGVIFVFLSLLSILFDFDKLIYQI